MQKSHKTHFFCQAIIRDTYPSMDLSPQWYIRSKRSLLDHLKIEGDVSSLESLKPGGSSMYDTTYRLPTANFGNDLPTTTLWYRIPFQISHFIPPPTLWYRIPFQISHFIPHQGRTLGAMGAVPHNFDKIAQYRTIYYQPHNLAFLLFSGMLHKIA